MKLRQLRRLLSTSSSTKTPVTPDLTTPVDVASIRLKKPRWSGLAGLEDRLKEEGSLVRETLREMEGDKEFQLTAKRLKEEGQAKLTLDEKKRRRRALDALGDVPDFATFLREKAHIDKVGRRRQTTILQVNVGLYCNQACNHCHVESSPKRVETMTQAVADRCVDLLRASPSIKTLDITGGAPELNSNFRRLVDKTRAECPTTLEIIDRCNLTVLSEPGQEDLAAYLASQNVRIVASLPCYSSKNVDMQRGKGVFARSIAGLRKLNAHGFGVPGSGLFLDLVYNPLGAFLPPDQTALELKYHDELADHFGVTFNNLFTMTNMPIKRFADFLWRRNELCDYMGLLVRNFNASTTDRLMCQDTLSVNYDGALFDCDFNQQLDLALLKDQVCREGFQDHHHHQTKKSLSVFDVRSTDDLLPVTFRQDNHCFGCTAGMGSS